MEKLQDITMNLIWKSADLIGGELPNGEGKGKGSRQPQNAKAPNSDANQASSLSRVLSRLISK
jgi:hypothetical protein